MKTVIRPAISYTVANAKNDVGNPQGDLTAYLKKSDYETDKETLVSDEELTSTLASYATNAGVENALSSYASKTLLSETVSDRPTFAVTDAIAADVSTLTDQMLETQTAKANVSHEHSISDVTDLSTTLAEKAATTHKHTIHDVNGLYELLGGKAPNSHSHSISDVTDLSTTLAGKASATHTHTMSDITNLTVSSHTHTISDVTDLSTTLAGKATSTHTHSISDITDLSTTLASKAASTHNHAMSDITDLTTTLAGKAATTHTHTMNDITDLSISNHTHNFSDIKTVKGKVWRYLKNDDLTFGPIETAEHSTIQSWSSLSYNYSIQITINKSIYVSGGTLRLQFHVYNNTRSYTLNISYDSNGGWSCQDSIDTNYGVIEARITNKVNLTIIHRNNTNPLTEVSFVSSTLIVEGDETVTNNDSNNDIEVISQLILKRIYPIGAIYTSFTNISPATLFGFGTWEQIVDRFLYCSNSSGTIGGEATHLLTKAEMPVHNHGLSFTSGYAGQGGGASYIDTLMRLSTASYTDNAGGLNGETQPHNNMPPYITVYCWKRTA